MDNSSRNIVYFIATITIAALILMGAHFYAQSQEPAVAVAAEEPPAIVLPPNAVPATEQDLAEAAMDPIEIKETNDPDQEVYSEVPDAIDGQPSNAIVPGE